MATKESLHLNTPDPALITVSQNQTTHIDNTLTVEKELELAIGLTNVVQANAFAYGNTFASGELERSTSNGGAVNGVAVREGFDVTHSIVGGERRWEVGIHFSCTIGTPHESGGEAFV